MNSRTKTILACVVCLLLGYFVGREYIKYQMRTAMQDAVKSMQTGISSALAGADTRPAEKEKTKSPVTEQPITANLIKKSFSPEDIHNRKFDANVTITVNFENKTGKDIRAFDGVLVFTDLLGNRIIGSRVEINQRIVQGGFLNWEGALKYNQFMSDHQRLRDEPKDNIKVAFNTGKILFEDGTTKEYE
jgi:hypothetical protein